MQLHVSLVTSPNYIPVRAAGENSKAVKIAMGNFIAPDTPGGASSHGVRFSKLTNVAAALIMINFSINLLRFDGNNY